MNHEAMEAIKKTLEKLVAQKTAMLETAYNNKTALVETICARNEQGLPSIKLSAMLLVVLRNINNLEREIRDIQNDINKLG